MLLNVVERVAMDAHDVLTVEVTRDIARIDALVAAQKAGSDDDVLQKVADSSTSVDAVKAINWRDIEDPGERLRRRIEVEGVFLPIMNMCCLHYCIEKGGGKESCCDHECGALQPLL